MRNSSLLGRRPALYTALACSLLCFLFASNGWTQTPPPELKGPELRAWLVENYYEGTHRTLGYRNARRAMYNFIDNNRGTILGVYGGYVRPLPFDPAGRESNPGPINAEHTVPQSFFEKREPMRSDLHHLFPTYNRWNSTRHNYPFREIPDDETTKWMFDDDHQPSPPPMNERPSYSEYANRSFEPPENHKGNVARATFYFFTMYPGFDISRVADINTLYAWHLVDGVDARERERNARIQERQGKQESVH